VHDPNFGGFGGPKVSAEHVETAVKTTGQIAEFFANIFGSKKARREAEAAQQQALLLQQQEALFRQQQAATQAAPSIWPWAIGGTLVLAAVGAGAYFLTRGS